jgi:hypothetical protein
MPMEPMLPQPQDAHSTIIQRQDCGKYGLIELHGAMPESVVDGLASVAAVPARCPWRRELILPAPRRSPLLQSQRTDGRKFGTTLT